MSAGPPSASAATQTAMKAPDVPVIRTCPEPIYPTRMAWSTVVAPLTSSAAKGGEGDVGVGLAGDAGDDRDGDDDGGGDHQRGLQAGAERERDGRALVRLVAHAGVGGWVSHGRGSPATWAAPAYARSLFIGDRQGAATGSLPSQSWKLPSESDESGGAAAEPVM